jgi:hypothetical protein
MKRAFQFFLFLYPRGHRDQFAEEMLQVFEEASAEGQANRWTWYVRFALAEFSGLIGGAARAWLDRKPVAQGPIPSSSYLPQELIEAQRRVDENIAGMVHAIANHQFERARILSNQEREAREHLRVLREKYGDELGMSFS